MERMNDGAWSVQVQRLRVGQSDARESWSLVLQVGTSVLELKDVPAVGGGGLVGTAH